MPKLDVVSEGSTAVLHSAYGARYIFCLSCSHWQKNECVFYACFPSGMSSST